MKVLQKLKKFYWKTQAKYIARKFPINKNLIYFGITGTDGKTTTSSFLYELAKALNYKPLLITTVSVKFNDEIIDAKLKSTTFFSYSIRNAINALKKFDVKNFITNLFFLDKNGFKKQEEQHRTTPLASELRRLIREYEKLGANFFILETTSHALDQYRIFGIDLDTVIFTNITSEHLDYHGTWENYAKTKSTILNQLKPNGTVSLNFDDKKSYDFLIKKVNQDNLCINYKIEDFELLNSESFFIHIENKNLIATSQKSIKPFPAGIKIFGKYNVYNSLAALGGMVSFLKNHDKFNEETFEKLVNSLKNLKEVEGRMNFLSKNPTVIVDFAHTPNAVKNALISAKELKQRSGKLWVVFGCAGLRDKYKRPEMGKFAFEYADNILITSEDPRIESLKNINDEIISGFNKSNEDFSIIKFEQNLKYKEIEKKYIVRFDEFSPNSRKDAIKFAITNAKKDDIVIILGKGHEKSIAFGETEYEWSDIKEVKKYL